MLWLSMTLGIAILLVIVLASKIKLYVRYHYLADPRIVHCKCQAFYGLVRLNFPLTLFKDKSVERPPLFADLSDKLKHKKRQAKQAMHMVNTNKHILLKSLKQIQCELLYWHTSIGTGDASQTAVLTGTIWGMKSTIIGMTTHFTSFVKLPNIEVVPYFNAEHFDTELRFNMMISLGTVIKLIVVMLWHKGKSQSSLLRKLLPR